ncbi:MAG: hypothetical protein M3O15_12650 [Acidobacteriota bacterium]|nr:hypothetical protein [Acidobacteriota bacterium]
MSQKRPLQMIQVGNHQIPLPEEVTLTDWGLERVHWQNPRIRAFLGCIRLLEGVLESNYSILHCSPERLLDIWGKVRQVSQLIRNQIGPLLRGHSKIPALEEARLSAELSLGLLAGHVLDNLDRFPAEVPRERLGEVRKLLCVSIGQLHAFLQDTFGEFMACDPRSQHDSDYFLSRRFPQDIDEAEWLHATVNRLRDYLERLDRVRPVHLAGLAERMRQEETVPAPQAWEGTAVFLDVLLNGLTPKLREVLALRGVRFHEMEILDRYAIEIPIQCRRLLEVHAASLDTIEASKAVVGTSEAERLQGVRHLLACHATASRRMVTLISDIDQGLKDLVAFLPLWMQGIEKRRALLLRRGTEDAAPRLEGVADSPGP